MRQFKHKTLWWIAQQQSEWDNKYVVGNSFRFPEELLINSSDREEVVERDWVEKCVDEIFEYQRWRPWDEPDYVSIRKIIEKHAPKQKMFTREEVESHWHLWEMICDFLKEHNLLVSSDE